MLPSMSKKEEQWIGANWKQPYVIYILATLALFLFLLVMGFLAYQNGWLPADRKSVV